MPRARRNAVAAKPDEPVKPAEPIELVDLDEGNDVEDEAMEEEVEYEEVEEEIEEEEEVEEVEEEEEEEEAEEEEAEEEEEEKETAAANGANEKTNPGVYDDLKNGEGMDEDESEKHAELLALPPHGSEVYVGGIPHDASEEDLKSFCEAAGEVAEVRIMKGKDSVENKGYAFVTYRTKELASKAIEDLSNTDFMGKKVKVSASQAKHRLFIGNVPRNWVEDDLKEAMKVGPGVTGVDLVKDPQNSNRNRGFAFIEYYNHACAEYSRKKMSTPNFKLDTNAPTVSWADPKSGDSSSTSQVKALYVKNLPKNVTQDQLKELFKHHGEITKVVLPPAKSGQEKSRFGFVHFAERSMAMKALKNTEKYELDGQVLECSLAKPPADKKGDTGSNAQKAALLPTYPPRVNYGVIGGAYSALPAAYGAGGFGQSMIYGRGPAPAGMAMVPMLLPDGRVGYVLQQPPQVSAPQQRGGNRSGNSGGGGSRSGNSGGGGSRSGNSGGGRQSGDNSRGRRYRPY